MNYLWNECKVTQQIWKIIRGGTTLRLNSNFAPNNISQKALIGNIMPAQYLVKFNIFIEILLILNSHKFEPRPQFHVSIPRNVSSEQLNSIVKKLVFFHQMPIMI
ncbi:unnamed protein product [Ambrosiozyma monospora]|uniref:Unnamed protein product n=1 Tax=Ambrosiozyma monospora TaxID=43982 RepID=A0ACB5SSV0_AMBMO|nr:unnamed protein product [Ambrosiozyma monospora]